MLAWLIGKALQLIGQHRDYQANSVRYRNVLSTIFLGLRVIDCSHTVLTNDDVNAAVRNLLNQIHDFHTHA